MNMFQKLRKRWRCQRLENISAKHDRCLPAPTDRELALIDEVQKTIRQLEGEVPIRKNPGVAEWQENLSRIRELSIHDNLREFLRWDVIRKTMEAHNAPYVDTELMELQKQEDWPTRWAPAIKEDLAGHPLPHHGYPVSSSTLIHHCYHLMQFQKEMNIAMDTVDFIVEFGGGYGSMCRLFHKLGFHGRYVIFDFSECGAIQTFFLKSLHIPVVGPVSTWERGVRCVSDVDELLQLVDDCEARLPSSLFIATWSISESPLELRNRVFNKILALNAFLIAYQKSFSGIDNLDYFQKIIARTQHRVTWHNHPIQHLHNNHYLFGKAKTLS